MGYFRTKAHFNGHQCPVSIYVVDDSCEPVIGRDLLTRLGITVDFGLSFVHQTEMDSNAPPAPEPDHSSHSAALDINMHSTESANVHGAGAFLVLWWIGAVRVVWLLVPFLVQ